MLQFLCSPLQCENILRSAKSVVVSLFCILVDRPMGVGGCSPPIGYAIVTVRHMSLFQPYEAMEIAEA